ncbi:MAG: hypothetical protein NZM25_02135 [Leptospiraceae bacterium]|nr:hypothetical protein [Leptospiraceae bacterium]MDW8306976.1 hypothetical protein [Leptospiraceae bacterium]
MRYLVIFLFLSTSAFSFTTSLYPGEDSRLLRQELIVLPLGPSWYSAHNLYLASLALNHDTASFALNEEGFLNHYGSSYLWQRFYLQGADISHPGEPGRPVVKIPFFLPSELKFVYHQRDGVTGEGWHFLLPQSFGNYLNLQYSWVYTLNGPPFFSSGLFDREPAQKWGAPTERRGFLPSHELAAELGQEDKRLVLESIIHERNFVSTPQAEKSQRQSLFAGWQTKYLDILAGAEYAYRDQQGAEWSDPQVSFRENFGILSLVNLRNTPVKAHAAFAFAYSREGNLQDQLSLRAIEDEVNHRPLPPPKKQESFLGDQGISFTIPTGFLLAEEISPFVKARWEWVVEDIPPLYTLARTYSHQALDVIMLEKGESFRRNLFSGKVGALVLHGHDSWELQYDIAMASDFLWSLKKSYLRLAPQTGLKFQAFLNETRHKVFFSLRQDVPPLTQQEASILVSNRAYTRNLWNDTNANLYPESAELSSTLPRFGAEFTQPDTSLSFPYFYESSLGYSYCWSKRWQLNALLTYRLYHRLYELGFAPNMKATFSPLYHPEIEGHTVYNRTDSHIGEEFYVLKNSHQRAHFASLEWQLIRLGNGQDWFLNTSAGAYLHLAYPPPGNGGFYNDIGVLHYSTADPNGRLNLFGRTDYDRGYMLKIFHGFFPFKNFSITNSLQYRDGVPLGKVRLVDGLSQGPLIAQYSSRGGGLSGLGRYAFYLQWDIRLLWRQMGESLAYYAALDLYNLNHFSLELKERHYYDTLYRAPVESVVGRTIRLTLGFQF